MRYVLNKPNHMLSRPVSAVSSSHTPPRHPPTRATRAATLAGAPSPLPPLPMRRRQSKSLAGPGLFGRRGSRLVEPQPEKRRFHRGSSTGGGFMGWSSPQRPGRCSALARLPRSGVVGRSWPLASMPRGCLWLASFSRAGAVPQGGARLGAVPRGSAFDMPQAGRGR